MYTLPFEFRETPSYYMQQTAGFSTEASAIRDFSLGAYRHLRSGIATETLDQKFLRLATTWKRDTMFKSSVTDITTHSSYLEIIGMGDKVLPFIFSDLIVNGPSDWFVALSALTGVNPILREQRGDMQAMTDAWIRWGRENFYVA